MADTAGEKVEKYYEPTYVTIGMDAITDATHTYDDASAGAISTGDLLWNGFSTPAFSGLENVNKYTTKTWVSSVAGSLSSSLPAGYRTTNLMGYQMFGNKYAAPMSGAADGTTTGSTTLSVTRTLQVNSYYLVTGLLETGQRVIEMVLELMVHLIHYT